MDGTDEVAECSLCVSPYQLSKTRKNELRSVDGIVGVQSAHW